MAENFEHGFNIVDAISIPTELKGTQSEPIIQELNDFDFYEDREGEFEEILGNPTKPAPNSEQNVRELKPNYDAKVNASGLVHMLTALDSMVLGSLGSLKTRKDFGGSKVLKKMKQALVKQIAGGELTDEENKLVEKFKEFKANMELLAGEVFPNETEINNQIQLAIPYMEKVQWEISEGMTFWISYGGNLFKRGSKIFGV